MLFMGKRIGENGIEQILEKPNYNIPSWSADPCVWDFHEYKGRAWRISNYFCIIQYIAGDRF